MEPGAVFSCSPSMERFVTHDGMLSVVIIIIQENKLWVFRRGGKHTTRVFRGNISGIWELIRGIPVSFVWSGGIINGK